MGALSHHRPVGQPVHPVRNSLLELHVRFDIASRAVADVAFARAENLVAHQRAVLEVHVQPFAFDGAVDDAAAGFAGRLGKVQRDELTVSQLDARRTAIARISRLQRVVRSG